VSRAETVELTLEIEAKAQELAIAALLEIGFERFLQEDDLLKAYIGASHWSRAMQLDAAEALRAHGLARVTIEKHVIEPRDWNELWERSLQPLAVGDFIIKPSWARVPAAHSDKVVLEIDPKMSFGTGHHESTALVLRVLPELVVSGDRVLDAGTGTGILAIAAIKLGASSAVTFDFDEWARDNAPENFGRNQVADKTEFRLGSLEAIPEGGFDLVLANINRRVLLEMLPALAEKTRPGGHVVISGMLREDRSVMTAAAAKSSFALTQEETEDEWWAGVLKREADA
jgi:ribosomal protein L11 methyltransferase